MSRWGGRKVARLKWQVAAVHGTACYVCGCAIDMGLAYPDPHSASVEHVVPRRAGVMTSRAFGSRIFAAT